MLTRDTHEHWFVWHHWPINLRNNRSHAHIILVDITIEISSTSVCLCFSFLWELVYKLLLRCQSSCVTCHHNPAALNVKCHCASCGNMWKEMLLDAVFENLPLPWLPAHDSFGDQSVNKYWHRQWSIGQPIIAYPFVDHSIDRSAICMRQCIVNNWVRER